MTVDYSYVAAFDVRNIIWAELQSSGILNVNDYIAEGFNYPLVPIIPSQQVPEFNNLLPGKTYMTYDIIQKPIGSEWWISEETMIMQVISRSNSKILTIINFLTDLLRRYELTASDVNFLAESSNSPFKFFYFKIETANPVQPFTDEGGFMSGDFSFIYTYTRSVDQGPSNSGRYV
jgi:hypothetical protein